MMRLRFTNIWLIARKDVAYTLRERHTLVWLLLMPLVFFYFIGTITAGFSVDGGRQFLAVVIPDDVGFLSQRILAELRRNEFTPLRFHADGSPFLPTTSKLANFSRQLRIPPRLTAGIRAGRPMVLRFTTTGESVSGEYDAFRIKRAVYTVLADIVAVKHNGNEIAEASLAQLDAAARNVTLRVISAGKRKDIPTGMAQAVPGIMVMFTLMISLTSGAISLFLERKKGTLRRLASAPLSRGELVTGKWLGKLMLNGIQILFAMLAGSLLFKVHWGPDLPMVIAVLALWAGFCAALGLVLGSVGRSEGQVSGIGVLTANLLAALGGCWWPIEITPSWMQTLSKFLPTGWTMNALHELVNFQNGATAAVGEMVVLALATVVITWYASRRFCYQ